MMKPSFAIAIADLQTAFAAQSHFVNTGHWQGMDIKNRPEMGTWELLNQSFTVPLLRRFDFDPFELNNWRKEILPNLPWADNHFEERVCGQPINPGKTWEYWPYNKSAAGHLDNGGKFNHNYMERYWPKNAGYDHPTKETNEYPPVVYIDENTSTPHYGIYHQYGDLLDVVDLLVREPTTRQAYIPIFFPEDTGSVHQGRIPCSLGYHIIQRGGYCHIVYYLRSCDFVRHFRDDIYLTLRLLLWVISKAGERSDDWRKVRPGTFTMHITSLHMFRNDMRALFGQEPNR